MSGEKGLVEELGGWDEVYEKIAPAQLPWNAGKPDSDLVRLFEAGRFPAGRALDLGTGPGHDAAYLANNGFEVHAIDISPKALTLARETAASAGVSGKIRFLEADVLRLKVAQNAFTLINDRGCFHVFEPKLRPFYTSRVHRALKPGGKLFLRTFSDKEPPGPGPRRLAREELLSCFETGFKLESLEEGIFEGPRKPKAWLALFRKTN